MYLRFGDRLGYRPTILLTGQLSIREHLLLPDHLVAVHLEHEVSRWTAPQVWKMRQAWTNYKKFKQKLKLARPKWEDKETEFDATWRSSLLVRKWPVDNFYERDWSGSDPVSECPRSCEWIWLRENKSTINKKDRLSENFLSLYRYGKLLRNVGKTFLALAGT